MATPSLTLSQHRRGALALLAVALTFLGAAAGLVCPSATPRSPAPPAQTHEFGGESADQPLLASADLAPTAATGPRTGVSPTPERAQLAPVTGRLLEPDGRPAADVLVGWRAGAAAVARPRTGAADPALVPAHAGADGRFALLVPIGVSGGIELQDPRLTLERAPPDRAATAAGLDVGDLIVVAAGRVQGTAFDQTGRTVAGVHLELSRRGTRQRARRGTSTDPAGHYCFTGLAPGPYLLLATAPDLVPRTIVFELPPQEQSLDLPLHLDAGGTIAGVIVDDVGHPVALGSVAAALPHPDEPERTLPAFRPAVVADAAGAFVVRGLGGRRATLAAWSGALGPRLVNDVEFGHGVVLRLARRGTLRGRLTDAAGRPLSGSTVAVSPLWPAGTEVAGAAEALRLAWDPTERSARTNADGTFTLVGVPAGTWSVHATGATHLPTATVSVVVAPGSEAEIELRAERGRTLVVRVEDPRGHPAEAATVSVLEAPGSASRTGDADPRRLLAAMKSDRGGEASFAGLPPGRYAVEVRHDRWAQAEVAIVDVAAGTATATVRLVAGACVEVRARDQRGAPRAGIACCAVGTDGTRGLVWRGRTDASGRASSPPLAPGSYVVALLPHAHGVGPVDVAAARRSGTPVVVTGPGSCHVELTAPQLTTLHGTVFGAGGLAADVEVRLAPLHGDQDVFFVTTSRHAAHTDADGRYAISDLAPGRYRVQVGRPGRPFRFEQEIHIPDGLVEYALDCTVATGVVDFAVTTASGERVPGARVQLMRRARPGEVASGSSFVHTAGDGTATTNDLVPGVYDVTVTARGFVAWHGSVRATAGGRASLAIDVERVRTAASPLAAERTNGGPDRAQPR